jgi:hypothetical protein
MSEQEPVFRVIRGTPTAEEVAALVGAIVARARPAASVEPPPASAWVRRTRPGAASASGVPVCPGIDAWRLSGLPR